MTSMSSPGACRRKVVSTTVRCLGFLMAFVATSCPAQSLTYDFEDGLIPPTILPVRANMPWEITSAVARRGSRYSLRSGPIPDQARSAFELRLPERGMQRIRFWLRVDATTEYDRVVVFANERELARSEDTNRDWIEIDLGFLAGGTVIEVNFDKDNNVASGPDGAFIDDIVIEPLIPLSDELTLTPGHAVEGVSWTVAEMPYSTPDGHALVKMRARPGLGMLDISRHRWDGSEYRLEATASLPEVDSWNRFLPDLSGDDEIVLVASGDVATAFDSQTLVWLGTNRYDYWRVPGYVPLGAGDMNGNGRIEVLYRTGNQCISLCFARIAKDMTRGWSYWGYTMAWENPILAVAAGDFMPDPGLELLLSRQESSMIVSTRSGERLDSYPLGKRSRERKPISIGGVFDSVLYQSTDRELVVYDPRIGSPVASVEFPRSIDAFNTAGSLAVAFTSPDVYIHDFATDQTRGPWDTGIFSSFDVEVGDFSPHEGLEYLVDGAEGYSLFTESSDTPLWTDRSWDSVSVFSLHDVMGDALPEVLTATSRFLDQQPPEITVRELSGLAPLARIAAADPEPEYRDDVEFIDLLVAPAGPGENDQLILAGRYTRAPYSDFVHVYDLESLAYARSLSVAQRIRAPLHVLGNQLVGRDEGYVRSIDLDSGELAWQTEVPGEHIEMLLHEQLDGDAQSEFALLTDTDSLIVLDSESRERDWEISLPGARAIDVALHRIYVGFDDRVEQYNTLNGSLLRTFPLAAVAADKIWIVRQGGSRYLFVASNDTTRLEVFDVAQRKRVSVEKVIGAGLGEMKPPQTVELDAGAIIVGLSSYGLVTTSLGSPNLPAPGTLFRSGFESVRQ